MSDKKKQQLSYSTQYSVHGTASCRSCNVNPGVNSAAGCRILWRILRPDKNALSAFRHYLITIVTVSITWSHHLMA